MLRKKVSVFMVFSFVLSLIIVSCKKSPTGVSFDELVGKWVITKINAKGSMSYMGMKITMDTTMTMPDNNNYFRFYRDNSYSAVLDLEPFDEMGLEKRTALPKMLQSVADTGSWSLSGNKLTMNSYSDDTTIVANITISGNSMTMTIPIKTVEEGMVINITETFFMTKQ